MIDEKKLREKLANIWKRKPPITPSSFAEADALINEVIEAATVEETAVTEKEAETEKPKKRR